MAQLWIYTSWVIPRKKSYNCENLPLVIFFEFPKVICIKLTSFYSKIILNSFWMFHFFRFESYFGRMTDGSLCVTRAMQHELAENWRIKWVNWWKFSSFMKLVHKRLGYYAFLYHSLISQSNCALWSAAWVLPSYFNEADAWGDMSFFCHISFSSYVDL